MIRDPETGHQVLFIEVPESKSGEEPHPLRPDAARGHARRGAGPAAGARRHRGADLRGSGDPGSGWVVLADPEGNEFCILRSRPSGSPPCERATDGTDEYAESGYVKRCDPGHGPLIDPICQDS